MPDLIFREYREGDEKGIVDLFHNSGPQARTVDSWNWMNRNNPFGENIVEIAIADGMIIGHYAVMKLELLMDGKPRKAGFAVQAVIHTKYRGKKTIVTICDRIWKRCADEGLELVYGFPNDRIVRINREMMGWDVFDFRTLEVAASAGAVSTKVKYGCDIRIVRIDRFTGKFDEIWKNSRVGKGDGIALPRTAEFLNWRLFDNPLQHYIVFAAEIDDIPVGYAVLKLYKRVDTFYGHIIDIAVQEQDGDPVFNTLLAKAFDFFRRIDADKVSCWMLPGSAYREELESMGFKAEGFRTNFGYKPFKSGLPANVNEPEGWHLTMADSDAF